MRPDGQCVRISSGPVSTSRSSGFPPSQVVIAGHRAAVERGMLTLLQHGAYKVARGITTAAEVLSVTAEDLH